MQIILHIACMIFLTTLTQIGGAAYFLTILIYRFLLKNRGRQGISCLVTFLVLYGSLSIATRFIAPYFDRVPLACWNGDEHHYSFQSPLYCLLNRHYVAEDLEAVIVDLSHYMNQRYPGTETLLLDANFPFWNGFPLLPHLSHNDGRKIDLAFYYQTREGDYVPGKTKSPIGYFAFEKPGKGQAVCPKQDRFTMRWDMEWFRPLLNDLAINMERTATALKWLTVEGKQAGVTKIFLEPHLTGKLGVKSRVIRFQGCFAARHDDHIHLQVK